MTSTDEPTRPDRRRPHRRRTPPSPPAPPPALPGRPAPPAPAPLEAADALPGLPPDPAHSATPGEDRISGEVLRIVFANDEGTYVVLRLRDAAGQEQTLVGPFGTVLDGQDVEAWGQWENHREHGRQFRAVRFRTLQPTTEEGIRRYLASGVLPGVGAVYAERIVRHFGARTLDVLDGSPERLRDVPGLGRKRIAQIIEAWARASTERDIHVYLQGLGVGTGFCQRIVRQYGAATPEVVRQNPYRLAAEVQGIGFLSADRIAQGLGVQRDSPLRLEAGVVHVLSQLAEQQGHTCCPRPLLLEEAARVLGVDAEAAAIGLQRALTDGGAVADAGVGSDGEPAVYTRPLHAAESGLAKDLAAHLDSPLADLQNPPPGALVFDPRLNPEQRTAVERAFRERISIITGGPGVGKTTVISEIVAQARRLRRSVLLAAPTGRAAKRMAESCGIEAKTIHRLLCWDPSTGRFAFNERNRLRGDLLVVDEVSMLDVELASHLFRAVPWRTRVVLVGDRDQLPSVGPGAVLHDLIACRRIPATHLTRIYRQDEHSRIVTNAHAVNRGEMPDLRALPNGVHGDFYWIDQEDPERVAEVIARLVSERIPATFRLNPMTDIQVLAPMNKGNCGAHALNERLQRTLNGRPRPEFRAGERLFRVGDRIMQVANNYDKGVFNGEMGQIVDVDAGRKCFSAQFDVGTVDYGWHEAEQVRLAYAVTVHKSQGCEFPAVIVPLLSQHFVMLQRNLVYTAMTRARKLLVMVGTRKALAIAVRNDRPALRYTRLAERLAGGGDARLPLPAEGC
jgi:exodeoxyribonuclease V alpha subunit